MAKIKKWKDEFVNITWDQKRAVWECFNAGGNYLGYIYYHPGQCGHRFVGVMGCGSNMATSIGRFLLSLDQQETR